MASPGTIAESGPFMLHRAKGTDDTGGRRGVVAGKGGKKKYKINHGDLQTRGREESQ